MRRLLSQDVLAGLMFAAFGAAGLILGADLRMGTAARMGPGYVPTLLSWILIALGAFIALRGLVRRYEVIESLHWRPIFFITLAVLAFALLFQSAGLLPALIALVALGALASPESRFSESIGVTLVLLAICIGVFKYGLGMIFDVIRGVW